jgi:hypothetical protein
VRDGRGQRFRPPARACRGAKPALPSSVTQGVRDSFRTLLRGRARRSAAVIAPLATVLAMLALAPFALSAGVQRTLAARPVASATLEECVTAATQAKRAATFSGEMTAIPGSAKMEMRIDVLEREPSEAGFHVVSAEGLGVWRSAAPGVKTFKYIKQVTNLAAPAYYRGAVHFRWLSAKGKLVRTDELRTPRCLQTVPLSETANGEEQPPPAA